MVQNVVKFLNVVVSEFGKMASDIRVSEKCSDIYVESVRIGFHAKCTLHPANPLFFLLR